MCWPGKVGATRLSCLSFQAAWPRMFIRQPQSALTTRSAPVAFSAQRDFHPDLLRLMTIAVVEVHTPGGVFEKRYEFPSLIYTDLPIGPQERAYLERIRSGESTLDNHLPFWMAALVDRYLLFVLPIALLLMPVISRSPVLFTIYNKRKITRWYQTVRSIDRRVAQMDAAEIDRALQNLELIETRLREEVTVSEGYMADYYNLRGHMDLVRGRLARRRDNFPK